MELGGKLLNSLRIETQFLERLQSVSVVDGATHTQKDDVESNEAFHNPFPATLRLYIIVLWLPQVVPQETCHQTKTLGGLSRPIVGSYDWLC